MDWLQALILGLIQGLTEFIPVSSSGHLVITQYAMGFHSTATFDAMVNLGTFLALLVYFWPRILEILKRLFVRRDVRLTRNLIISAIPVGLAGFLLSDFFESSLVQQPLVVAFMLVSVGLIMIFIDKLPRLSDVPTEDALTPKRALLIGLAQMVSLIPGTSRSGSSIIAGRLVGLDFKKAAEYSFLLSLPVMAAVVLRGFLTDEGQQFIAQNFTVWAVSNVAAFGAGMFAVGFMMRYLAKGNLKVFGYYRIALAVVVLVVLMFAR
ncbi:MAG TPA: undecaprenyl-diphosphate phosphatase [Candidatus Saccharimonadales bacterium]|nr:undecaprenyl-diphosphate phosphatase [Candidatus Saccharimonadales bacterium]